MNSPYRRILGRSTLADFDAAVFGQDPWRLFRSHLLAPFYSVFYVWWFPITFGTMGVLAFSKKEHSRLILAYILTLILGGTFGQYVLPFRRPNVLTKVSALARGFASWSRRQ